MHPIEHLRYVARAQGVDAVSIVEETAYGLGSMMYDGAALVVACRRIVERHPFNGPLWWLCANIATSSDGTDEVWELAQQIRADPTGAALGEALPDGSTVVTIGAPDLIGDGLVRRGDVRVLALDVGHTATSFVRRLEHHDVEYDPVDAGAAGTVCAAADVALVEALAIDSDRAIVPLGSSTIAAAASAAGTPVWVVAGVGRRLPKPMIDSMANRIESLAAERDPWDLDVEALSTSLFTDVVGPYGKIPMGPPAIVPECPMAYDIISR